jgi:hypothetical protein
MWSLDDSPAESGRKLVSAVSGLRLGSQVSGLPRMTVID